MEKGYVSADKSSRAILIQKELFAADGKVLAIISANLYSFCVYKAEINWSILTEGLTLPVESQVVFSRNMGKFVQREN
ncbi:hypothetical protein P22_1461 [Propionispora sp. 2/2-37]|uniref:hypothetical protein n=1 Tax=Propionispora sp. 2/2-37 TaxID=1677858 RepID=UPI0006BB946C|nr:hypothetical protein [Propionispora sp. 2/2-37]CUH95391.1 hypothetical protein P22_1461 [Propionispora sp. 2/2-37]